MIRKYQKQDAPAWQRRLVVFVSGLFAATLLLLAVWAIVLFIDQSRIDACLDQGGSWDYERGECDFQTNRPGP